jgi:hypothetical protein
MRREVTEKTLVNFSCKCIAQNLIYSMNFKCTFYQEIVFEFSQRCQRRKRKIKGNNKPQQQQFIIRSLQFLLETLSDE